MECAVDGDLLAVRTVDVGLLMDKDFEATSTKDSEATSSRRRTLPVQSKPQPASPASQCQSQSLTVADLFTQELLSTESNSLYTYYT